MKLLLTFRATMTERELLPGLLDAGGALHPELSERVRKYLAKRS